MGLARVDHDGVALVEANPGDPLIARPDEAARVIEACLSEGARGALLYAANLTPHFFDLSSGEAGAVLDKLRRFRIRLAVVCAPGCVRFSTRFHEFVADDFAVFDDRRAAVAWLAGRGRRDAASLPRRD